MEKNKIEGTICLVRKDSVQIKETLLSPALSR